MVKKKDISFDFTESEKDGDSSKGSGGSGSRIAMGLIPGFYDIIATPPEEAEIAIAAEIALFENRVDLKRDGYKVDALDKKQELRNKLSQPGPSADFSNSGGSNFEDHPELVELGGAFDNVVLPESEEIEQNSELALQNKLKNRLGMGLSAQSLRQEYEKELKKKQELTARPKFVPEQKPDLVIRPVSTPRPKPPGF